MWVAQHALVVLLVVSRAACTPVDASLSPLDDEGDPLWLDRASHRGSIEARADIEAAEAVTRDKLAHVIRNDVEASRIDAEEAEDIVHVAQLKAKNAHDSRRVYDHNNAVLGVVQDKYEREYLELNAKLEADQIAGAPSAKMHADEKHLRHMMKRVALANEKESAANTKANEFARRDHMARRTLTRAREDSEMKVALEQANERDHKSAVKATQDAKQDAAEAAEDARLRAAVGVPPRGIKQFEQDNRAGYIVVGKDIFQARLPGKHSVSEVETSTAPDYEAEEAEEAVNDAMFSERQAQQRDVKWAHKVGATHGFGAAAELGESLPVTTLRSGSAIEAVNQVENIAKRLTDAAQNTKALARGPNGADGEMIEAVKALASINQAANITFQAAAKAHVSDKIEQDAENAVNGVGLGQSNSMKSTPESKELEELRKKVRHQEVVIAKLKQQSGPFAAEHEADRWMHEFNQKETAETAEFDKGMLKARRKARNMQEVTETQQAFVEATHRVNTVREDVLDATNAADKAIKAYDARVSFSSQSLKFSLKMKERMDKSTREFESFGPPMTKEQIAASADAKAIHERRGLAEDDMKEATKAYWLSAAESRESMEAERKSSLEAIRALHEKVNTIEDYWAKKADSIQAKCEAQKALGTNCQETEKLLELESKTEKCQNLKDWRQWLANNTATINYIKTKEMYRDEQDKVRGCQHLLHASRNATNYKIQARSESEMPLPEIT